MSSSKITGWWELINKLLKLNLSQAFLKAFTSLQKLHCRTTIFEKNADLWIKIVDIIVAPWCSGYHYCTTSFNKAWTGVLCRFKSCSRRVRDGEDLWQWSRMEIRLNAFRRSAIPQKQFIIIIICAKLEVYGIRGLEDDNGVVKDIYLPFDAVKLTCIPHALYC